MNVFTFSIDDIQKLLEKEHPKCFSSLLQPLIRNGVTVGFYLITTDNMKDEREARKMLRDGTLFVRYPDMKNFRYPKSSRSPK